MDVIAPLGEKWLVYPNGNGREVLGGDEDHNLDVTQGSCIKEQVRGMAGTV